MGDDDDDREKRSEDVFRSKGGAAMFLLLS
jgi:hypothetical protein